MGFVLNKWGGVGMGVTRLEPARCHLYLRDRSMDLSPKYKLCQGLNSAKHIQIWSWDFSYFLGLQGGDIEKATDWIFSNPAAASSSDMDATTSSTPTADAGSPDGGTSIYSDFLDKWYLLMVVACRMTEDSTGRVV
ncbi:hypothetical protein CK203_117477 [Vitis vinifera]|uniref:Uncharacterized protein n=1 Tax=Vitis vinifera TaxID=29760 RepID=A0A438CYC1_VITVI|nr:hypothetical protein CK203_117477 [Vitis vinifera]